MMFLIGRGERIVAIGPAEPHHCPRCGEEREFIPQLKYEYGQFDVLFGFVYGKRYQLACAQCNHGWILDTRGVEQTLERVPIPFHLRFGWIALVALVGGISAWISWRGS